MDLAKGESRAMSVRRLAAWLVRLEIPILLLVYAYFVVTDHVPLAAFGMIGLIWLARVWTTGKVVGTPFDLPILILLAWLPISAAVSNYPALTMPKIYGVLLSVAFFYAVVNQITTRRDLAWAAWWLVLACIAISIAGLVGTDWAQNKIISMTFIYDRLPHVIQGIPRSIAGGFARNGVGGTLTLIVPLLAALVWVPESDADKRGQTRMDADNFSAFIGGYPRPIPTERGYRTRAVARYARADAIARRDSVHAGWFVRAGGLARTAIRMADPRRRSNAARCAGGGAGQRGRRLSTADGRGKRDAGESYGGLDARRDDGARFSIHRHRSRHLQ